MRAALAAVEWPDDELSVFATVRGSLFAVPDECCSSPATASAACIRFGFRKSLLGLRSSSPSPRP